MEAAGEEAGGMEAAGEEVAGMEADGEEVATTADGATGTLAIIVGTAAGDGGVAVLTRGGCFCRQSFRFQFRTQLTADMATGRVTATGRDMDTVQGTGMAEDTERPQAQKRI
jgi:hypothetical protein